MDHYTKIGFYLSLIGTVISLGSLCYSFYVGRKTKKTRDLLMTFHVQGKFTKSKDSIILNLQIAYKLLKENDFVDKILITETLIELVSYKQTLSKETFRMTKRLDKKIKNFDDNYVLFPNRRKKRNLDTIGRLLYSLKIDLKNDFNESEKVLEGFIK